MDEADMAVVGSLLARAVKAEHGTAAGDAELAAVAEGVGALVARAPAYPRS
jgi:glycine hydroxymethyltransferase